MERGWQAFGGDSCVILKDLGDVADLLDVTGQLDCPQSVIDLEQIMGAPSDEDVQALVASASDEALVERRRRNLAADRDPPSFLSWRVDCSREPWTSHHGVELLSHLLRSHSNVRLLCP